MHCLPTVLSITVNKTKLEAKKSIDRRENVSRYWLYAKLINHIFQKINTLNYINFEEIAKGIRTLNQGY